MRLRVLILPVAAAVFALPSLHIENEPAVEHKEVMIGTQSSSREAGNDISRMLDQQCADASAKLEMALRELRQLEERIMQIEEERLHLLDLVIEMQHERIPIEPSPEEFAPVPLAPVACVVAPAIPVRIHSQARSSQG